MNNTILHVDINSYFATILQQENPHLRGKPLGVIKEAGRTCLIAASKEAKKYGVKTGSRLIEAQQLCPQILAIPAEFERYLDITKKLKALFESIAPDVEIYSLDEAFIDLTNCKTHLYPDPIALAKQIQTQIKDCLGDWVGANVGLGPNRFLAKMASEISPPESVFEINELNKDAILATVSFGDVCGVGPRLAKKLLKFGITHPYQIRFFTKDEFEPIFGPFWTQELFKMSAGLEPHHLTLLDKPLPHMKSVGRSITGYQLCDDETQIKAILYNLMDEVTHKVRQMGLAGRQVSIHLSGQDQAWSARRTLSSYIAHTPQLFEILYDQLYQNWQRHFKIIKFSVRLGQLKPTAQINPPLLLREQNLAKLSQAQDKIAQKYGLFTLRSGLLLNQPLIRPEVTGFLGDKAYQLR